MATRNEEELATSLVKWTGTGVAAVLTCVEAGADVIDGATDSMFGMTSQPSMSAFLASIMGRRDEPEIGMDDVRAIDSYWAQLRLLYAGFDAKLSGPDPDVYLHEILGTVTSKLVGKLPHSIGGQLTNLMFQARELGQAANRRRLKQHLSLRIVCLATLLKRHPPPKPLLIWRNSCSIPTLATTTSSPARTHSTFQTPSSITLRVWWASLLTASQSRFVLRFWPAPDEQRSADKPLLALN